MSVLLGYGPHGRDIEEIYRRELHVPLDLFDDDVTKGYPKIPDDCSKLGGGYVGINDPSRRRSVAERAGLRFGHQLGAFAAGLRFADVGQCSVIAPNVLALVDVTIGAHTHINYGASMTRCRIGDFVTIAPAVTICGDVEIGDETFIGASATVCDRVSIGKRCVIAAGAIIPPGSVVPDETTVIGVWKR